MTTKTYQQDEGLPIFKEDSGGDDGLPVFNQPVKKKEPSTLSSVSSDGISQYALDVSPEQMKDFEDRKKRYEESSGLVIDENDPVGSAKKAILRTVKKPRITQAETRSSTAVARSRGLEPLPVEPEGEGVSYTEAAKDLKKVENFYRYNTNRALSVLSNATGYTKDQLYSDAFDKDVQSSIQKGNVTQALAYEALQDAKKANKVIQGGGTLDEMAIRFAGMQDPAIQKQIDAQMQPESMDEVRQQGIGEILEGAPMEAVRPQASQMFGEGTMGRFKFDMFNNPAFQQELKNNPQLAQEYRQEAANLSKNNPDFGKMFFGNIISQEMEDLGMNNGILNVVTKDEFDKVVASLKEKGKITLADEAFINENLRSDTGLKGLGKQIIGRENIATPGLIENALQGGVTGVENLGKGVAEATGIYEGLVGEKGALKRDIEKVNTNVVVRPEGAWHEVTQNGGQFLGQSLSIGGGGGLIRAVKIAKNPAVALGMSGGLQAYANYLPVGRMEFPGDPLKQKGFATVMAGIEALTENIFKDDKVIKGLLKDFKPLVRNTIEDFTQKKISATAARETLEGGIKGIIAKSPEAAKSFGKAVGQNTAEEVIAQGLGQVTQGVFEGKPMSEWLDAEDLSNTARQAFLGSAFIGALATRADLMKSRGITSKQIYLMARDPEYWMNQMQETAKLDEELAAQLPDKIQNLQTATEILAELDSDPSLTEKQKAKFLLTTLDSKVREQNASTKTDPILRAKDNAANVMAIHENDKVKEDIVNGDDDGTYEGDTSDELSKQEIKAAKVLATASLPGMYGEMAEENPVGVLQEISQQAQGIDKDGNELEGGGRRQDLIDSGVPEKVIDEAIKLYPKPSTPMQDQSEGTAENVVPSTLKDVGATEIGLLNYFNSIKKNNSFEELVKVGEELGIGIEERETDSPFAGNYDVENNKVIVNKRAATPSANTIAHEVIHGILYRLSGKDYENSQLSKRLDAFRDELFKYIDEKGIDNLGLKPELRILYLDYIRKFGNQEVVTFAFTNRQFAQFLSSIKVEGKLKTKETFWSKLKDIYRDALSNLGIKTKLDELIDLLDEEVPFNRHEQPTEQSTPTNEVKETTQVPDTPEATGAATGTPNQTGGATEEGGAIPPTEPPVAESAEEEDKQPERKFTKQMLRSDEVSQTSKGEIAKTLNYVQQTNDMSIKEANEIIDYVGLDEALNVVIGESGIKPVIRVVLGQILIKKYNELSDAASNQADRDYYLDKTIQVANFVTEKLATEAGQQIQAFSLWSRLSPEGQLRAANQDMARQGKEKLRRREKDINKIGDEFQKANAEAADEVTKSDDVKQSVKKEETDRAAKAKDKITKAKEKRANIIKRWKGRKGGNLFSSPLGLTPEGIEFVGDVAKTYLDEGIANLEILIDKIIVHLEEVSGKKVNDEVKKDAAEIAEKELLKYDNKLLGGQMKDSGIKFNQIVKEHYTVVDKAKKSLAQKFMDEMEMSQSNAEALAKKVQDAFDRVASRKKRNILYREKARFDKINRTLKGDKKPEQKTVADDIIKYSNLGAFENQELHDMLAEKFGLGKMSPQQAAKLKELADKIQKAPEGSPKRNATEDLLAYRANLRGNDLMETVQGVWYANILSGYKTQEKNIVSTFFNSMGELGAEMAKDPKAIPYLFAGYIKGVSKRGFVEAKHTITTGRSPIHIKKIETPSVLERKSFVGGGFNPGNWFKFVSRVMIGSDVVSFQGLKEARAYQLARREAQNAGLNTWSKKGWDKVNEILYHTKERHREARLQAEEEGLKGTEAKRRVYELMEESRPTKMTEDAYGFAAHGTFNHESEGTLGAITNAVAQALDAVNVGGSKPLRFIVPFTRIITNVVNNSLDYTPVALVRAARGVRGFRSFEENQYTKGAFKELSKEERQRLIAKAAIGISMAATLQALHVAGVITITGGGPDDEKKKEQLRQSGWQEYSIKVGDKWYSYKYTPLIFVTGFLGNMNDAEEYAVKESEKEFGNRMELAAWRIGGQVADMTWINSASTFLGGLTEKSPDQAKFQLNKALSGTARGFIPFSGALTQSLQATQKIFNMPQKQVTNSWQTLIQDIPIARNGLNDKINALGDPIVRDIDVVLSGETKDPVWKFLLDKKGWVAPVNKNTVIVIDKGTQLERPVTNDEYYEFSKLRGQKIKAGILNLQKNGYYFDVNKKTSANDMTEAQLNKVLSEIETDATRETKAELFGEKEKDYEKDAMKPVIDILNEYNK